jgi:hypothetical protein
MVAMKILLAFLVVLVLAAPDVVRAAGAMFYVAPNGKHINPGTREKPFSTLERARRAIRSLKEAGGLPKGGVTVWIRGGVYPFRESFALTTEDGGTADAPIVYRAYGGEQVILTGGARIGGFGPVTDPAVLARLDDAARGHVLETDLRAQGIADFGEMRVRGFGKPVVPAGLELFFNDRPMTLARWPNDGWAMIAAVPAGQQGGKFTYDGDRPRRWSQASDIWLHGYWTWNWADSYVKVKSIDTDTREIATEPPHGVYGYTADRRWRALNLLEELDEPGEWYLDRATGRLYFWPPSPIEDGQAVVSLLEQPLISLRQVSHVTIRGVTIECVRGMGVEIKGGDHDRIADCTLRNIGARAVDIREGSDNGVAGCTICDTGDGAVLLEGGDRPTLTPAGNYVDDCDIHDYARWDPTYRPAVLIRGVGNRIAHNLIYDSPHSAIILNGNDHLIELNEIHHVCLDTDDAGAFYLGRDWTERGNVVRYNYFHDLGDAKWVQAVYLDDFACGTLVYGNLFYRANRAVQLGGGRDNTIENNVMVDCKLGLQIDARGLGWAKNYFDGTVTTLFDRLKAVNYTQPPWSVRYPKLVNILEDEPAVPKGNEIVRNIHVGGQWVVMLDGLTDKVIHFQDNLLDADPHFVDAAAGDFRLRDDSPAFQLGFKPLPLDQIGPRRR